MKRTLLGLVLAAAAAGFLAPQVALASISVSPTVFREGGYPLRLNWTAQVRTEERGSFLLYRRQVGRQVHVATVAAHAGKQTYRIEDRGNLDASADYELRWRSASGKELVVGALRCERDSACNPWTPIPRHHTPSLENSMSDDQSMPLLAPENLGRVSEPRTLRGFVSSSHPPPRRGS